MTIFVIFIAVLSFIRTLGYQRKIAELEQRLDLLEHTARASALKAPIWYCSDRRDQEGFEAADQAVTAFFVNNPKLRQYPRMINT